MRAQRRADAGQPVSGGGLRMEVVLQDARTGDQAQLVADMEAWLRARHLGRVSVRVAQPPSERVPDAIGQALLSGEARLVKWTQDGTLVPVSAVEAAWGIKRQSVDAARERNEIFSVYVRGQHWYPAEALMIDRASLAAVVRALAKESATSKLLFLRRRHAALGNRTPAEAIEQGMLQDVLRLAAAVNPD